MFDVTDRPGKKALAVFTSEDNARHFCSGLQLR